MTRIKFLFDEEEFQKAYRKMAIKMGLNLNPDDPRHFYDYRSLYKETGKLEPDETGHFTSKYKLEGHPDMYVKGVKTKEEIPSGWKQRMRGIGELPEYEIPESTKLKFTADLGLGVGAKAGIDLPPLKPEEKPKTLLERIGVGLPTRPEELKMGIEVTLGTWEEQKRARPELQDVEDFGNAVFKQVGERNQIAYIHEALTGVPKTETLRDMEANWEKFKDINPDIDKRTWSEYFKQEGFWKTLITGPTKGKYDEAIRLHNQLIGIAAEVAEPGKDLIGQLGWKGMILLMGAQVTDALYRSGLVVKEKWVTGEKLKAAVERAKAAYIPKTGKFKTTLSGNDLAVVNRLKDVYRVTGGKIENIGLVKEWGVTEKGIKVPQVTFLYAGLPADEIVKSLVRAGKVTADIARELSLAKPELVSQVIQNLSVASPAIAAKLGSELTKLIPKVEPRIKEIPKLTKSEREVLINTYEEEGKTVLSMSGVSGTSIGVKAMEKLEERGYVKDIFLTEKGIELSNILKGRIEAEEKGIPIGEKEIKRPMTDKQLAKISPNEELTLGKINGEDYYTDTRIMLKGKPENVPISKNKPDFEQVIVDLPKEETKIEPTIFSHKKDLEPLVWFDNKVAITERYYDLILKKFPGAEFRSVEKIDPKAPTPEAPIKIYEADEFVGVVMPYKQDLEEIPERVLERAEPIPPIEPTKKVKEVLKKVEEPVVKEKVPKVEVKEPIATPKQIKKAHAIANSKAMISVKGKMKPQYRSLAKAMTGKTSIKKMTEDEAEIFIDSLNRLPEPRIGKKGELIPPTIPRTTKLVLQDFFKRKYKEPTPLRYLTPQTYYAEMLGIKPLVEPYEIGKQKFDLEFRDSSKTADRIINKLNKIAETPAREKLKSILKNIPTKAESNMAESVNKYEEVPAGLEQGLKDVFNWFRSSSRDLINRENKVRESVDLPPIKYRKAYFRHTADGMAKEMLEGKYPFPQNLKYWAEKMVGKKIFNPMEFQRKLSDDLVDLWSKDLRAVTRSMLWYGLKEIHLAQPAKFLSEQLNAISKDLPIYKNLSAEDKKAYDETRAMPASTKKWLIDYVNQVMKGQETETDAGLNRLVTQTGLKGLFNKVLSPFGRSMGRKPITHLFQFGGRVTISGVMGWVPRQIIRNLFQFVQDLALYGVEATLKSFLPASIDKNIKGLLSESLFLKSYTGFEELPTNLMGKLEKVWLGPYGVVAVFNATKGMKAAYWSFLELVKNPKYLNTEFSMADPSRTKDTPRDYLFPSEKEKLLKEMEFGAGATQYQYIPMGMPEVFRHKALVPLTRLQSWWMNYFTKFTREAIYRGIKGETGYGQKLPWSYRINYLKYIILGGAVLTALGYRRSFLLGVAPTWLSPAAQVTLGFYNYVTATSDWQRQKALRQMKYSWTAFIPGSLAWKDFMAVWNGEKDLKDLFFYKKIEKEEKIQPPLKITIPKDEKLKFIRPEIKKSTKLKFTF